MKITDFVRQMSVLFWKLVNSRPKTPLLAPACLPGWSPDRHFLSIATSLMLVMSFCRLCSGLTHVETTVHALVEICHAFSLCDPFYVSEVSSIYIQLLLSEV